MTDSKWLEDLKTKGWCCGEKVISKEKSVQYIGEIWKWIERHGTALRTDPSTWEKGWPRAINGNVFHESSAGHAQFMWDLRCEEGVIDVFSAIHGTDKL